MTVVDDPTRPYPAVGWERAAGVGPPSTGRPGSPPPRAGWPVARQPPVPPVAPPPEMGAFRSVARSGFLVIGTLCLGLVANLVVVTRLEHSAAQTAAFDHFRSELSRGTAPVGPYRPITAPSAPTNGLSGSSPAAAPVAPVPRLLALGSPIALIKIPSIGVNQVVGEGTTPDVMAKGPGHLRSTVFPGGAGTSIIFGRAGAYGGPFGGLRRLHKGARITVITGVGTSTFRVIDLRKAGDHVPPPSPEGARLTLATATGHRFVPTGVLWVDANIVGTPLASEAPALSTLPASEQPMGANGMTLTMLAVLWGLIAVLVLAVWTRHHRHRARAWIAFVAPLLLLSFFLGSQVNRLLPNLL